MFYFDKLLWHYLAMFGLSKGERNLKESKAYIENLSKSLENRRVLEEEAKAIIAIGYFEIDKIFTGNHKEPSIKELKRKLEDEFYRYFEIINQTKKFISKKANQDNSDDFYENVSSLLFVEDFFNNDYSDLIISNLVLYLESKYYPNARLLGNKYHGTFECFGTSLFSFGGYGLSLQAFETWEEVRRGYSVDGQINFLKIYKLLHEHKMKEKLNDYKQAKAFLSGDIE